MGGLPTGPGPSLPFPSLLFKTLHGMGVRGYHLSTCLSSLYNLGKEMLIFLLVNRSLIYNGIFTSKPRSSFMRRRDTEGAPMVKSESCSG